MSPRKDKQISNIETSDEVLRFLIRNFYIFCPSGLDKNLKVINIKGKIVPLKNKKNYLVNNLCDLAKNKFPHLQTSIIRKTIKKYLNVFYENLVI